jgi:hypothetical protein
MFRANLSRGEHQTRKTASTQNLAFIALRSKQVNREESVLRFSANQRLAVALSIYFHSLKQVGFLRRRTKLDESRQVKHFHWSALAYALLEHGSQRRLGVMDLERRDFRLKLLFDIDTGRDRRRRDRLPPWQREISGYVIQFLSAMSFHADG